MWNKKSHDYLATFNVKTIFVNFYEKPYLLFPSFLAFFVTLFYHDSECNKMIMVLRKYNIIQLKLLKLDLPIYHNTLGAQIILLDLIVKSLILWNLSMLS